LINRGLYFIPDREHGDKWEERRVSRRIKRLRGRESFPERGAEKDELRLYPEQPAGELTKSSGFHIASTSRRRGRNSAIYRMSNNYLLNYLPLRPARAILPPLRHQAQWLAQQAEKAARQPDAEHNRSGIPFAGPACPLTLTSRRLYGRRLKPWRPARCCRPMARNE
jgi:hypothetical protein